MHDIGSHGHMKGVGNFQPETFIDQSAVQMRRRFLEKEPSHSFPEPFGG